MNSTSNAIASAANVAPPPQMLQVSGLNVYYGESHILRDVDLNVPTGQMICLIGRNSTLR